MNSVIPFASKHFARRLAASLVLFAAACSGTDEADDAPAFSPGTPAGAGGTGAAAPVPGLGGQPAANPPVMGGGGTSALPGANNEGNAGSLPISAGGSGANAGNGSAGSAAVNAGSGGAPAGAAGSSMVGAAGAGNQPQPPPLGSAARVGAELCPPGPFDSPIPQNPQIRPLAAVPDNNFFILEGAVWAGNALYLSEIGPGNVSQIDRFTLPDTFERGVFTNTGSNGLALDSDGNLVLAAHDVGGISRLTLPGGQITRGSQQRNGQRFNSPNDLVVRGDGNVYFTDPDFQSPAGRIQGGTFVYRIAPPLATGEISAFEQGISNPNGITMSPDGNTLYVAGGGTLREYSLDAAGVPTMVRDIGNGQINGPDGMGMDCAGNIYSVLNGAGTILVFSPEGERIGAIGNGSFGGQGVTNVAFGGPNRTTLFITTFSGNGNDGLFSVELNVPGLPY